MNITRTGSRIKVTASIEADVKEDEGGELPRRGMLGTRKGGTNSSTFYGRLGTPLTVLPSQPPRYTTFTKGAGLVQIPNTLDWRQKVEPGRAIMENSQGRRRELGRKEVRDRYLHSGRLEKNRKAARVRVQ
jgi:hypothetical protein